MKTLFYTFESYINLFGVCECVLVCSLCVHVSLCALASHSTCVKVRGLAGGRSLLPPCGFRIKLRVLDVEASAFTHQVIFPGEIFNSKTEPGLRAKERKGVGVGYSTTVPEIPFCIEATLPSLTWVQIPKYLEELLRLLKEAVGSLPTVPLNTDI